MMTTRWGHTVHVREEELRGSRSNMIGPVRSGLVW
jgi:hypothetical protein